MMAASRRHNLNCYHFMRVFDARRTFLGSTPERLWRRSGHQLETEALAGTVANDRAARWPIRDDKNPRGYRR